MRRLGILALGALGACGAPAAAPVAVADLPLGDQLADDLKADGAWGAALTCKPVPSLPSLVSPRLTISLDGLTVHLQDPATGYDQVFPAAVGAIESGQTASAYRESKSYYPIIATGAHDFTMRAADLQPCKTWWTDPETGRKQPVFAGLPFLPWYGGFAMHGPIDNFRAPNGGTLRRGFVSHGCIRMEAADILEIYARVRSVAKTPVHVQREPERDAGGRRVDLASRWIGAECAGDGDCNFPGGFCKANAYSRRGFCSVRCTATCADRPNLPPTFCVADPDQPSLGLCVSKVLPQNQDCRSGDHLVPAVRTRFHQPAVSATVCLPGSPGWIGDHCLADGDCEGGNACLDGTCTRSCTRFCPDQPGWPGTFCGAGRCERECTPASNASECAGGTACVQLTRADGSPKDGCRSY